MRYYSDTLKKFYDTAEACQEAERQVAEKEKKERAEKERLANERKARAAEVEAARKALTEAQKNYQKVLDAFIKDYGSYHYTETSTDNIPSLFDLFHLL